MVVCTYSLSLASTLSTSVAQKVCVCGACTRVNAHVCTLSTSVPQKSQCVCVCVCMHMCMYVCVCVRVHTHMGGVGTCSCVMYNAVIKH
jgi:hypothetical protein